MFWRSWLPTSAMRSRTFCQLKLEYSFPSTHIRPDDGVLYAHNVEIYDVLPAPFAPKRTHLCPSSTFHVMESMIGLSAIKDKFSNSKILFIFFAFCGTVFIIYKNHRKMDRGNFAHPAEITPTICYGKFPIFLRR